MKIRRAYVHLGMTEDRHLSTQNQPLVTTKYALAQDHPACSGSGQKNRCKRRRSQTRISRRTSPRPIYNTVIGLSTAAAVTWLARTSRKILRERVLAVEEGVGPATGWDWSARRFLRRGGASYAAAHHLWLRVYTFECDN